MKRLLLILTLLLCFNLTFAQTAKQPLPPLPDEFILNSVINQTGGVPFMPLGVPNTVMVQLGAFASPFDQLALDPDQAVSYFSTNGALLETVIPLADNTNATLTPDITAPGAKSRPGKIVGAMFQPSRGVMIAVVTFKNDKPHKLRFYTDATTYQEVALIQNKFKDKDKNKSVESLDEGALITNRYSCVTVGLKQICWQPYDRSRVRDVRNPKITARDALRRFKSVYDFKMKFKKGDTVPDVAGSSLRDQCRSAMANATNFNNLCQPNLSIMPAQEKKAGQPIGIIVVRQTADLKTYSASDGSFVGQLPAGDYLVLDATPNIKQPGQIGVLMLVNADMVNHYLIPVMTMQGFGNNPSIVKPQAGVKDGFVWGKGFGY